MVLNLDRSPLPIHTRVFSHSHPLLPCTSFQPLPLFTLLPHYGFWIFGDPAGGQPFIATDGPSSLLMGRLLDELWSLTSPDGPSFIATVIRIPKGGKERGKADPLSFFEDSLSFPENPRGN